MAVPPQKIRRTVARAAVWVFRARLRCLGCSWLALPVKVSIKPNRRLQKLPNFYPEEMFQDWNDLSFFPFFSPFLKEDKIYFIDDIFELRYQKLPSQRPSQRHAGKRRKPFSRLPRHFPRNTPPPRKRRLPPAEEREHSTEPTNIHLSPVRQRPTSNVFSTCARSPLARRPAFKKQDKKQLDLSVARKNKNQKSKCLSPPSSRATPTRSPRRASAEDSSSASHTRLTTGRLPCVILPTLPVSTFAHMEEARSPFFLARSNIQKLICFYDLLFIHLFIFPLPHPAPFDPRQDSSRRQASSRRPSPSAPAPTRKAAAWRPR